MRKLIAIMTCRKNADKAAAQEATWAADIRKSGSADVMFFYGGVPMPLHETPGYVWLNVDDSYYGIPEKVRAICRWALLHGYDYLMKCDDDAYIAPLRFPALPLRGCDYVGRFRGPHGNYPAHFASGFAYWLSRRAMQIVGHSQSLDWMDERFVANRLALEGIFGYTDSVNYLVTGPFTPASAILQRKVLSSGTVFCEYSAKQQYEMHKYLRFAPPVVGHPVLREVPRVSITLEQFNAPPKDKPAQNKIEKYLR